MGEYTSTARKGKEIATAVMLFGVAFGVFYLSRIPNIRFPVLFQLLAVLLLTVAVIIITRYVMRRYTCRVEAGETGKTDFVIIEHYGKRDTVVCRVYASQVLSAVRLTNAAWKESAERRKGKKFYRYTASFSDPDRVLAEVSIGTNGNETFFLEFAADEPFLELLRNAAEKTE